MSSSFVSRLPLSRLELDRDYLSRDRPNLFEELRADAASRVLVIFEGQALLSSPDALALVPFDAIPDAAMLVYLGKSLDPEAPEPVGTPIVAALLDDAGHLAEAEWASLRRVGSVLSARDAGIFVEALGILNWHATHAFSPKTGSPSVAAKGGWVRVDSVTGAEMFPRTDAAIIVGIVDKDDRLLLGSNAQWESNRYSLLAGFVEPGESLEAAVIREVFEESGVRVSEPTYLGSQPWPFPASLMVGFLARVDDTVDQELTPDGAEILDLRWFTRDELAASIGEILIPSRTSIARAIIEEWFGAPIEDAP